MILKTSITHATVVVLRTYQVRAEKITEVNGRNFQRKQGGSDSSKWSMLSTSYATAVPTVPANKRFFKTTKGERTATIYLPPSRSLDPEEPKKLRFSQAIAQTTSQRCWMLQGKKCRYRSTLRSHPFEPTDEKQLKTNHIIWVIWRRTRVLTSMWRTSSSGKSPKEGVCGGDEAGPPPSTRTTHITKAPREKKKKKRNTEKKKH